MFTQADFEIFQARFQGDEEWNGRRLEIRRRLQALGESVAASFAEQGVALDRRESLHNPHHTNGKRVRRQRTMLFRDKKAKKKLQSFLGKELGKDLDSAMNNVHLQVGLDEKGAYWGLRLDKGAWYDLNVLVKRCEEAPGRAEVVAASQAASGYVLLLDGKGERPFEAMDDRAWRDLAGTVRPGESSLELSQRMPAHAVAEAGEDFTVGIVSDLTRLAPFFKLASWSLDSPSGASL